jgi:outer membrane protein, heavy metal efflux system
MPRFLILLVALLPLGSVQAQRTMTLDEAYRIARARNPSLHAVRAAADAVATRESSAALLPDPELQVGVMNLSLPGLSADMPSSMAPAIQAMQMIPTAGKLRLNGTIARQNSAIAESSADETWWEVRTRVAMAFYEIHEVDAQVAVMEETLDWLRQFEQVATSMYSVGGGRQSDVLRAGVDVARMRADLARVVAMRTAATGRLNALLDRPAEAVVAGVTLGALPAELPDADELARWAEETRPMLARGRLVVDQGITRESLARREIWPDVSVGVQYGQRPTAMGTEHMGSLMLGFTLPMYAGRRQLPMREEAGAMRGMAVAELAEMRAEVRALIASTLAGLDRNRTLLNLYRTEVLPQAEANVTSAFSAYRVGRVDFMTLLDAQMTLNEYRQELHVLVAGYGRLVAELEMIVGRELPVTTKLTVEER